jgi:hypothetical protein
MDILEDLPAETGGRKVSTACDQIAKSFFGIIYPSPFLASGIPSVNRTAVSPASRRTVPGSKATPGNMPRMKPDVPRALSSPDLRTTPSRSASMGMKS